MRSRIDVRSRASRSSRSGGGGSGSGGGASRPAFMDAGLWMAEAKEYSGSGAWLNQGAGSAGDATVAGPAFTAQSGGSPAYWSFNGSSQYMSIPDSSEWDFSDGSVCNWFMVVSDVTIGGIIWAQSGVGNNDTYDIRPHSCRLGGGSNTVFDSEFPGESSTPTTTVIAKAGGGGCSLYVNGVLVDTGDAVSTAKATTEAMNIGRRNYPASYNYWGGRLYMIGYSRDAGLVTAGEAAQFHSYITSGGLLS